MLERATLRLKVARERLREQRLALRQARLTRSLRLLGLVGESHADATVVRRRRLLLGAQIEPLGDRLAIVGETFRLAELDISSAAIQRAFIQSFMKSLIQSVIDS